MLEGLSDAPVAFHDTVTVNGEVPTPVSPEHVPGLVPVLVAAPLLLVIGKPLIVPPLEVQVTDFVFAVVVDGCVFWFVSGGLIFTLPVIVQCTVPCASPRAVLPAKAGVPRAATVP